MTNFPVFVFNELVQILAAERISATGEIPD